MEVYATNLYPKALKKELHCPCIVQRGRSFASDTDLDPADNTEERVLHFTEEELNIGKKALKIVDHAVLCVCKQWGKYNKHNKVKRLIYKTLQAVMVNNVNHRSCVPQTFTGTIYSLSSPV